MSLPDVFIQPFDGPSVCLFCASSDGADPAYLQSARDFGAAAAAAGWRRGWRPLSASCAPRRASSASNRTRPRR